MRRQRQPMRGNFLGGWKIRRGNFILPGSYISLWAAIISGRRGDVVIDELDGRREIASIVKP